MGDYAIRTPFEEKLSNESYQKLSETEKLNIWRAYIQFEIDDNQMSRATRLYRRASLELGHRYEFWESFVTFAIKKLKDPKVLPSLSLTYYFSVSLPSAFLRISSYHSFVYLLFRFQRKFVTLPEEFARPMCPCSDPGCSQLREIVIVETRMSLKFFKGL